MALVPQEFRGGPGKARTQTYRRDTSWLVLVIWKDPMMLVQGVRKRKQNSEPPAATGTKCHILNEVPLLG